MRYTTDGRLSRTYRKWTSMLQRCENPKHLAYPHYGAKGVRVCERWHDYDSFEADMGEAPAGLWLDRIDNTRGYEPGNCRWVTPKESAANRVQGGKQNIRTDSLRQKAIAAGLPYHVVYQRMRWYHWPEAKALSTPIIRRGIQARLDADSGR